MVISIGLDSSTSTFSNVVQPFTSLILTSYAPPPAPETVNIPSSDSSSKSPPVKPGINNV